MRLSCSSSTVVGYAGVSPSLSLRLHALAFLYDHILDFSVWMRTLTPGQLQELAKVMLAWHGTANQSREIIPLAEVEKREITRALSLCNGDVNRAAKALQVGKTTLYRKLKQWGYSTDNRILMHQASALGEVGTRDKRVSF